MNSFSIYVIDDEESVREGLAMSLEVDYQVEKFVSAESALRRMGQELPDMVLLDIGLPGISGIEALEMMKELSPEMPVIMITAYEDIATVISAMKLGAYDFIVKPIHMDVLDNAIKNALETISLRKEVKLLQQKCLEENQPGFIGESGAIRDVMDFIKLVAESPDTPVMILGETGTGKELIARAVHFCSPNFQGPFVTVNCAAIPKDLLESELFGYERGAFSGASDQGKKGLVEMAEKGTLFLDELGDLGLSAQAKLLRFLESGEFYKVGGTSLRKVKTRIVSATNKDIEAMIEEDRFRRDLYFRLGVVKAEVPSLNQRKEDILPLAKSFLTEFSDKFGREVNQIAPDARDMLLSRNWTGNIRELRNLMELGVLVCRGKALTSRELRAEQGSLRDLESVESFEERYPALPEEGIDLDEELKELEKHYIRQALRVAQGNESQAAKLLSLNHHTFRYRKKKASQA